MSAIEEALERQHRVLGASMSRADSHMHAAFAVALWNRRVPAGTVVDVVNDDGSTTRTTTRSEAWMIGVQPVVALDDRVGGYLLWRCLPVEDG